MTKCGYCGVAGHKITTCTDTSIKRHVDKLESIVRYDELYVHIISSDKSIINVICAYYKLGTSGKFEEKMSRVINRWIETHQEAARATAPPSIYARVFPEQAARVQAPVVQAPVVQAVAPVVPTRTRRLIPDSDEDSDFSRKFIQDNLEINVFGAILYVFKRKLFQNK